MSDDRRPFLFDQHVALGAKIVPFGGWAMPLHYATGTLQEHLACRHDAVVFDVSHLGTVRASGPDVYDILQSTFTNDLAKVAPGRAQYTHLLNDNGGVEDDIIVWWVSDQEFDVMPNASNTSRVLSVLPGTDVTSERCVLAVQGPHARAKIANVDSRFATVPRFAVQKLDFRGVEVRVAGTGYTGEDGIEIAVPNEVAAELWAAIVDAEITPAGLGSRDTLRLEAALPLHGHELSPTITPLEAKLSWVVGWSKPVFRGREALFTQREEGVTRHLTGLVAEGRQPLREGATVRHEGRDLGVLTSGNFSPVLQRGIGLGLLSGDTPVGTSVIVELRGREVPAMITALPFIRKAK